MDKVFFRNDDVFKKDTALEKVTGLFLRHGIPISHQVIPSAVEKECVDFLNNLENVEIGQHGYKHVNNGGKDMNYEFGQTIPFETQRSWISEGKKIMRKNFGKVSIFTPPYYHFDDSTFRAAKLLGFRIFSSDESHVSLHDVGRGKMMHIPTNVDLVSWGKVYRTKPFTRWLKEFERSNFPVRGFCIHHRMFLGNNLKKLEALIKWVKKRYVIMGLEDIREYFGSGAVF